MGLLDLIGEPAVLAEIEARRALVEHLARAHGWSIRHTSAGLDIADQRAMERFAVGNTIPRETLH